MHSAHQGIGGFDNITRRGGIGLLVVWLMLLVVPAIALASHDDDHDDDRDHHEQSLFGPKKYTRAQGKPSTWTSTFTACSSPASATLKLTNGSGSKSRVSSAVVTLNGVKVIAEKDLNRKVPSLARTVNLKGGVNTITVTIKSGAGDDDDHHDGDDGNEHHDGDDEHSGDDYNDPAAVFLILQITGAACGSSDTAPPVISTPQPADGALLAVARPPISVAFTDNSGGSGIDTSSVRVTLDGSDITSACSITATGAVCTPAGNLNDGMHSVTVALADLTKNQASYIWRFTTDTTPPQVAVTSPQNGQNLGSPVVTVTGTVDDASATITVNGIPATLSGLTFSAADVPLTEGANSITVIARDPLGNQSTATLNVTLDTSLPVVTITAPLDGSFTNVPTVTVSGTVGEPAASAMVNGRPATLTGSTFTLENLPLAEGQNSITAEALDLAGNKGSAVTTVMLDTVNPQIFVTAPADGLLTRNPQLTVSGTVSEPLASLTVNGQAAPVDVLAFTTTLTLNEGANSIVLNATDRAGNKGAATLTVTLDSTPPTVPVLEALTSPTNNPSVTVKGSAEPGSSVALSAGGVQIANSTADTAGLFSFSTITLTEGETLFTAQATDSAGNAGQPSAPLAVILDTVAPSIAIGTPLDGTNLNTPIITVSGSIDDPAALVTVNGLLATNSGGVWTLDGFTLQEGTNTLLVEARDPAGNKGGTSATVVLDTIPPVVAITAPVDGLYTNITQVIVTGTVNEAVASVTVNGTSATLSASSTPVANTTFTATLTLTEGANSIVVTSVDKAGNKGTSTINVTLDTIAPQLTPIGPADGALLNHGQISFGGSAAELVVSVLVNGIAAQAGSNGGYTLPVTLVEGSNTLTVTATDRAGNRSTSTITVNLDSIAPAAPLLDPLATPTRTAKTVVSGQAEANSTVKLFNNGVLIATLKADAAGLFSVADVTLTEGNNLFTAQATDAAGNVSQLSAPLTLVLDTKAPVIAITSPADRLFLNAPAVTVTGSIDDQTATVTVNGIAATISGATFTAIGVPLSGGANILVVTAIDPAGNQATAQVSVTLDTALPVVTITAPLDGSFTAIPAVTVSGTVSEAASTVTVNGKTATLTGNSFTLENLTLAEGQNTLNAQAVDLAGNKGTAIATVTLDTVDPQVFVATPVDGLLTRNPQLTLTGTVSEPLASLLVTSTPLSAGTSIQLNGQAFTTTLTLNEGANSIVLTATDRAGNKGTATINVTLDSTPPVAPVLEALPAITNNPLATLRGSAEAGSSVILYIGDVSSGQTVAGNSGLFSFPNITLAEGMNTFTAVSLDQAGNTSLISESVVTTLDTKAPLVAIAAPSDKAILNTPVVTVSGSIDDPAAQVTVNGLAALNSGGIWTLEGFTLQEGTNTLLVEARDPAGNKGSVTATVVLDTVPPVVAITAPVDGLYTNVTAAAVNGTISETVASVTINGRAATITAQSYTLSGLQLAEGANIITVEATDLAGNKGTATVSVTLDTIAPQLTVIGPADGALLNNGQITFGGSAAEPVMQVTVNGIAAQAGSNGGYTLPVTLAEGSNALTVTAIDRAGNSSTSTINVNLDSIAPAAPLLNAQATPTRIATTTVSGQAEANSTVKLFNNNVLVTTLTADAAGLFSAGNVILTEGNNPFTATATDAAGNTSALSALLTVVLDTKAPVITVTAPHPGVVVSAAQATITGTVDETLASLTINGASTPLSNLAFEYVMTLAAGENSALITATDLAGNVATTTITIQRDSTPPKVTISAPLNGLLTSNPQIQVSGTVDDAEATLTVAGSPVTVTNKAFSVGYVLSDGDNSIQVKAVDKAGNEGTAAVTVTLDAQAPVVTLNAPATATAGTDVQIAVNATDNRGLTLVDVSADGASLWSVAPNAVTASQTVSLRLSPTLTPGATVTVRGRALDAAGNSGSATAVISIDKGADGPGWLQGKVLDDSRGLPLAGAQVSVTDAKGVQQSITIPADGAWFFELSSGAATVEVTKSGFTTVRRDVTVRPGQRTSVLDSRLTKLDATVHTVDATGGVVKSTPFKIQNSSFTIDVQIPADTLSAQVDARLTPVSNQGLIAPLPLGWSPLAVADLRLLDPVTSAPIDPQPLAAPVTLTLPLPDGLGDTALTAELARYDSGSHRWLAVAEVAVAAKATSAAAQITQSGQYALLLADPAPFNPPAPAVGQELIAVTLQPSDFSLISTTGRVVPQAAPPSAGLRAAGDLLLVAKPDAATAPVLISGLVVNARVSEKFDLTGGSTLQPAATVQDIVLYRAPCATSIAGGATDGSVSGAELPFDSAQGPALRTTFPVAPSRDFTIVDLLLGKISIEITQPDTSGGVMVGADGARLLQPDGTSLSIPAGALTGAVPVTVATLPEATVSSLVGADFRLLRGVDIAIAGQTLKSSATLSIPAPAGFDPALPVVVAKKFDVKGGSKLKQVAAARLSGSIINSEALAPELTSSTNSINSSGQYLFLQAVAPIGYVAGQITDAAAAAFAGIQVSAQSATLADLTGANGQYLLALAAGSQTVSALDPARGDAASATVAIAANAKSILNLTVAMTPPTVVSISPANGAANVQPTVPVVVTFSKPMDKNSINSQTLKLTNSSNSEAVPGVLTFNVDNTAVTFYPSDAFKQETTYDVTVAATVRDLQGYQLGHNVASVFVVRRTTPPAMPAAGAISGTFPDADGFITVTGTQGSAAADNTVLLINDTSGEIQSVTPASNGSFSGRIRGQLGDEIKVVLMDYSGNQTTISYLTFKSPDGSYLVTAKGGKIEGDGGSILDIPEGALVGPTVIKLTTIQEANLPSPLQTPGKFLGAVNIDTGGIAFQRAVDISIPMPDGFDPKIQVFVTRPGELVNGDGTIEKVYEIIDSTKAANGRVVTACWPYDGVVGPGAYAFTAFPEVQLGVVSGYAYQDMNLLSGYQPPPAGSPNTPTISYDAAGNPIYNYSYDSPIQGAVVRAPAAWNYVSYSSSAGFYAGFTTLYGNVGASDLEYKLTAIHPQTMQRENVTGYIKADGQQSYNIKELNFKLADKTTVPGDTVAPVITLNVNTPSGQNANAKIIAGTVPVGTDVFMDLSVSDQKISNISLTIEFKTPDMETPVSYTTVIDKTSALQAPASGNSAAIYRYMCSIQFTDPVKGSQPYYFRPNVSGVYTIIAEAVDAAGNKSKRAIQLRAAEIGEIPTDVNGAPFVDSTSPTDSENDVQVNTNITVFFNEPVQNVTDQTFMLIDKKTNLAVPASVYLSIEDSRVRATLVPNGNLYYDRNYEIVLSRKITDVSPNAIAGGQLLLLNKEYHIVFKTKVPKAYDLVNGQFGGGRGIDLFNAGSTKNYACVTAGANGYKVVDVTDYTKPQVASSKTLTTPAVSWSYRGVSVDKQSGVVAMTSDIDFHDGNRYGYVEFLTASLNPAPVGNEKLTENLSGLPNRVVTDGNYAYVTTIDAGLQIVDIQAARLENDLNVQSTGATIVGVFDTVANGYGEPNDVVLYNGGKLLLTTNSGYLLVLDVSVPSSPTLVSKIDPSGLGATRVAVAPNYLYANSFGVTQTMDVAVVGSSSGKIATVDLSDPSNPSVLGAAKDENGKTVSTVAYDIVVNASTGLAFITTYNSVQVFDIKNPYNPRLLNTIIDYIGAGGVRIPIGQNMALVERDGVLYLANNASGFKVLDMVSKNSCDLANGYSLNQNRYDDIIKCAAIASGVNPLTIKEIIAKENGAFDKNKVVKKDRSTGLMQITPGTARGAGMVGTDDQIIDELKNPCANIDTGARIVAARQQAVRKELVNRNIPLTDENIRLFTEVSFNGGPGVFKGIMQLLSDKNIAITSWKDVTVPRSDLGNQTIVRVVCGKTLLSIASESDLTDKDNKRKRKYKKGGYDPITNNRLTKDEWLDWRAKDIIIDDRMIDVAKKFSSRSTQCNDGGYTCDNNKKNAECNL